ncbi:MAG: TonB-dependent receptor [Bacteroidaceae bacterium]|nr:TonB-dependent receptor [Bacteroidaceae bacterium]
MKKYCFILLIALSMSGRICAQDNNRILQQANQAFEMGHFAQADTILLGNLKQMNGDDAVKAYHLLALSSIYQDRKTDAETYINKLLDVDPYYTSYDDPPRFAEMLEKQKKNIVTVTTASKIAESADEVPVPLTLITEKMIKASGAHNLSDILLLFVPGYSAISGIEGNLAMRGISGLTQETVLVLIDGHRLNSQITNAAAIDYRNSVDKIKQIEVLRGPASSLYGNVALTAVINIITKSGSDLEGGEISGMAGRNSTYGGTLMLGNGNIRTDYMAWASVYTSKGEPYTQNGLTHYIDGYNSLPAYDLGMKVRWGDLSVEAFGQHGKMAPFYNLITLGNGYSYDKYGRANGEKPGASRTNISANTNYNHDWDKFSISASLTANMERSQIYNVLDDSVHYILAKLLSSKLGLQSIRTSGLWQSITWQDYSFGASVNGTYQYEISDRMFGSILCGLQYDMNYMADATLQIGADYVNVNNTLRDIMTIGTEHTMSAFLQAKHNFTKRLIFNGGLRYDYKIRIDNSTISTLSPRATLIWKANQVLSLKGGYSHSFVDAPFFYRGMNIDIFSGGSDLNPETMDAFQLSAYCNWQKLHLSYEANVFYNMLNNMVSYNPVGAIAGKGASTFINSPQINIGGIENVLQFANETTLANLNFTYQLPFSTSNLTTSDKKIYNVPNFMLNLTVSQRVLNRGFGQLNLRANMHFQSEMECLDNDLLTKFLYPDEVNTTNQPAYAVFGAGIEWATPIGLSISFDAYNLSNEKYIVGGNLQYGIPAKSFNFLGKLIYSF